MKPDSAGLYSAPIASQPDRKGDEKHGAEGRPLQGSGVVALVPSVEKLSRRLSEIPDKR
jgi:hypothetical protein